MLGNTWNTIWATQKTDLEKVIQFIFTLLLVVFKNILFIFLR